MKKLFLAEFIGTFFLIFFGLSALIIRDYSSNFGSVGAAFVFGTTIGAATYFFGRISGAHFNPALSFASFITAEISFKDFLIYVISQILAGFGACFLLLIIFSERFYTASIPSDMSISMFLENDISFPTLILILESIFSFFLALVYFMSIKNNKIRNRIVPIFIGGTYFTACMILLNINGFGINPLRVVIPALFKWNWTNVAYYVTANFIGALIGGITATYFKK
ncbi:MAG TPA: aquaporin [Spirochaetota bacterium]|jgi:aquaporin Z|nr:MAG: Glycerol uptake facilitator protein [Spirochaetes bacterium ADurb.Bin133]HNZ27653.1 aquaporin [Spirochaetota bacterium]HPY86828.1 aquaporin [Spirochaetota bacterium]